MRPIPIPAEILDLPGVHGTHVNVDETDDTPRFAEAVDYTSEGPDGEPVEMAAYVLILEEDDLQRILSGSRWVLLPAIIGQPDRPVVPVVLPPYVGGR